MPIITESRLRAMIRNRLLEGFQQDFETLLKKFPQFQNELQQLNKPKWVSWLMDRFVTGRIKEQFPIEHAIDSLLSFSKNEMSIGAKWKSNEAFRNKALEQIGSDKKWQNPTDITNMTALEMDVLNALATQKKQNVDISGTTEDQVQGDFLGKVGPWNLWMPTTRENSCRIGAGTTWCTARTSGSNLFYSYVARPDENIVLFYAIKDGAKTQEDRLSIGFLNGKPVLNGKFGGLSVDGQNYGLTKGGLEGTFGADFDKIISILSQKSQSIKGQHPAKAKMIEAAQDVEVLKELTKGLSVEERKDFYRQTLQAGHIAKVDMSNVLNFLADSNDDDIKMLTVGNNFKTPVSALRKLASSSNVRIRCAVAATSKTPADVLMQLAADDDYVTRTRVAMNRNAPKQVIEILVNDTHFAVRRVAAANKNITKELLVKLSNDKSAEVRRSVANNVKTPVEILIKMSDDKDENVLYGIIYNKNTPMKILEKIAHNATQPKFPFGNVKFIVAREIKIRNDNP